MKYGLADEVLERIIAVFAKFSKVEQVMLYGSRAKGNYKNGSDIDLALTGEELNLQDLHKIELTLDELYLPYTFDLTLFARIDNTELIDHIDRVGIIIYARR